MQENDPIIVEVSLYSKLATRARTISSSSKLTSKSL